jgi:hypothetical protein
MNRQIRPDGAAINVQAWRLGDATRRIQGGNKTTVADTTIFAAELRFLG